MHLFLRNSGKANVSARWALHHLPFGGSRILGSICVLGNHVFAGGCAGGLLFIRLFT
jgi:hypothetical protein